MNKAKLYKNLNFLFKWGLLFGVLWYLGKEFNSFNFRQLIVPFSSTSTVMLLVITLVLMPLNWGLETAKWKMLIKSTHSFTYSEALKSILCGVAVSLYTPNRIGDIGGRLVYIPFAQRTAAVWINLFCSGTQWLTTVVCGLLAVFIVLNTQADLLQGTSIPNMLLAGSIAVFIPFLAWKWRFTLLAYLRRSTWFKRYLDDFSKIKELRRKELSMAFLYSVLRYAVFSIQYWLLLLFFDVELPVVLVFPLIALVFFVNTLIPSGILTSLGVRGSAALALFGMWSINTAGILAATMTLWMVNLVLPAAMGVFIIPQLGLFPIPYRK